MQMHTNTHSVDYEMKKERGTGRSLYRAICGCGWKGMTWRSTLQSASQQYSHHLIARPDAALQQLRRSLRAVGYTVARWDDRSGLYLNVTGRGTTRLLLGTHPDYAVDNSPLGYTVLDANDDAVEWGELVTDPDAWMDDPAEAIRLATALAQRTL